MYKIHPQDKDFQFILKAAHQFILGRSSQDVTILIGWLKRLWCELDEDTRVVIVNRTKIGLHLKKCGGPKECELWEDFVQWTSMEL